MSLSRLAYEPVSGKLNAGYRLNSLKPIDAIFGGTGSNTGSVKTSNTTYSVTVTATANTTLTAPTSGTLIARGNTVSTNMTVWSSGNVAETFTIPITYTKMDSFVLLKLGPIIHTMGATGIITGTLPTIINPATNDVLVYTGTGSVNSTGSFMPTALTESSGVGTLSVYNGLALGPFTSTNIVYVQQTSMVYYTS